MDSLTNIYGGQDLYRIDQSSEESSSKDPERSESKLACPHGGHHHENHGDQEQGDQEHGGHKTRRFVRIKSLEPTDTGGRLVHRPLATKSVAFKSPSAHQVAAKPFSRLLLDGDEMDEEAGNRFHPFSDVVRRHSSLFTDESVSELGSPGPVSSGYRELPAPTKERNFIQRIFHRWFTFKSSVGEVDPAEDYLTGFRTLPIPSLGVGRMSRQLIWSLMFGHNAGFATRLLNLPPGTIWEQMRLLLPILNEMACTMAYSVCWTLTFNQVRQEYADSHPNGPVWPGTFAAERARLRTGTTPIGTTPIGTTPIGTTPIGTTPIGTTPIGNVASARALVVGIWPLGSLNDQYWWGEVPTVLWALVGALSAWMLLVDMACLFRLVPFRDLVFSSVCHMAKEVWFLFAVLNSVTYSRVTLKKDIEQATVNLRIRTQVPFPPVIPGASWIQLLWRWLPSLLIIFKMVKNFSLISSVLLCRKYKRYNVPHPKYESFPGYPEILIHCDPTDLQDLPDATVRPTTARPTTARPTTARPTTARPTTADAVPTSSQDSLLKTSCLTEDAIFTRNANGSNDGSSVMPSPPLTAAADEGGGDDESGAADEGGDVNDESGVAEEAGNHDGAGAAEEAGNHDGAGAADEGGAADEDENGGEKEGEESGTKSKFGEPNSNKLSRDKATVQVASGRADEEGYIPVSSLLLYNLSVNFTGPVSLHSRVLEGKDLIKSLRLLDLIMTRQYTNIRLKALVALFLFFLYPAWTTAAAFSVSLSMMGIYWLVSHAMRLLTLRTLEVQDLLPKLISHYNQYTFTPNDRLFLSLSHVDENFRKHGLFSAPGRT
ncbi:putative transmembrane protein [Gregarina niphandrodes]|uniref:Transmembrane protein n=1 Tax=Gregarina niphandrodes TaxID=110365 RepID=A0A023BBM3_GRENI|nr:putative transmembrane protein [Gregarina niphandrodes]EZG80163.1 putative transmembrane protein [Gregarina niphandrodes]|eukprot:XP_011134320.1 putative transmembrane protein [Gregarina niphandrodes]